MRRKFNRRAYGLSTSEKRIQCCACKRRQTFIGPEWSLEAQIKHVGWTHKGRRLCPLCSAALDPIGSALCAGAAIAAELERRELARIKREANPETVRKFREELERAARRRREELAASSSPEEVKP